jgi:hypothetical protein
MATRIIEYQEVARRDPFPLVPEENKLTAQTAITATGTSAQSSAFAASTRIVCVQSDEAVYVAFGTNPTATANDYRLQAGGENFFAVARGQSWKVAVKT